MGYIVAVVFLLLLVVVALVNYSPMQTYLAKKAAHILSDKLETKVDVTNVRIGLLNSVLVQGVYVAGQANDTLLYAGEIQIRITDWFIFEDKPVIHYVGLKDAYVHLYRTAESKVWNYDFITDLFNSPSKKKQTNSKPINFDLQKAELENVRIHMDDHWVGEDMDYDIGHLLVHAKGVDVAKKIIDVDEITVNNARLFVDEYKGGRPSHLRPKRSDTFDRTPFNPDNWVVKVNTIALEGCGFHLKMDNEVPDTGHFDENHIEVRDININVGDITVTGDTIHGNINQLSGIDRSGFAIKKMRSKATVSPIASICENLYLETNYSKVQDYYAMHYKHFPDFNHYIDSVTMVAHMRNAKVDKRDIAYFAPELKDFPEMLLTVSGNAKGTVSNIAAQNLNISDGNIAMKGNLTMKGLPDIYTTYITYTEGEILTTGKGITHYAPMLKGNPDVAVDSITFAYFNGSYSGYIENFNVKGIFKTNLGLVTTDINMAIPGFSSDSAVYSGSVTADKLQIGRLLRQPIIGDLTLNEKITGHSFNPELMQMNLEGSIKEMWLNGYLYHNILTEGTLAKKQFDGKVLVDDPNLALDFDGRLNYGGKKLKIDATAHLLAANFMQLNITHDDITAAADFDLDWTGSSIDDFMGYAKLFNIDLKRNAHKLDIDSVFVQASGENPHRKLDISSDAFTVSIDGNYRLTDLPASVQYYLSRYIPNYISAPKKYAPDQNLSFKITTVSVDSIFAVTIPQIRGFDLSTVTGSLNTSTQKLDLDADIPYGSIGNIHLHDVSIIGDGNFNNIALNTTIGDIALGDSILHGALSLTSTIGNDSVSFSLATVAPDQAGSIALNGQIVAKHDTLLMSILPSQFYMKRVKWDISGGSNIVYSDKYLFVRGLSITSGMQRVSVNTQEGNGQPLLVNTENLDIAQIGNWTGLSGYQPDGRLSGIVKVDDLFNKLTISANMKATGVKLGTDTVGQISLVGYYDQQRQLIHVDPQTGIYRDNSSIVASGNLSLDSATKRKIDGSIKFSDARVAWAAPFLAGIMSNLSGKVNGDVMVAGSSDKPEIDGKVTLTNATVKIDYMGCNYTIPTATVNVNNHRIDVGEVKLYDSYKNVAYLSGYFTHDLFNRMRMRLKITTPKFEVMNLNRSDNDIFYGKLIASLDSFTIRGAFDNVRLNVKGAPAGKSTIFIPISSGGYVGSYNYVSFKTYGKGQEKEVKKNTNKIAINIEANMNPLAQIRIVLDPTTEDEIAATGTGNIVMDIPANNDLRINGNYTINDGTYTLTFSQAAIHKQFRLNPNSKINFNGPFAETNLDVNAAYVVRARMYDLLTETEKQTISSRDATDAQTPQWVNVILHMNGPIYSSKLTFDIDLESNQSQSSIAYTKLKNINNDERLKLEQVAALLLANQFIAPDNAGGQSTAITGAKNNVGQILSSTASQGINNILNKLIGNNKLNVNVKYTNYNYNGEQNTIGNVNRNQVKLGVTKNYLNDRLLISVGSTSDWGKPSTTSTATNFNVAGDFRLQYQLSERSGLRLNAFHNSDYDLTRDQNVQRTGAGISWRKSFDNFGEFFGKEKREMRKKEKLLKQQAQQQKDTIQ